MKLCRLQEAGLSYESSLMRGTWIEIRSNGPFGEEVASSLMRGTWIEIHREELVRQPLKVVPHARDVD